MPSIRYPCRCVLALLLVLGSLPTAAQFIISEVFYDAEGADAGRVFVELFGIPGNSLDGWSLIGVRGSNGTTYKTVALTGSMPNDGIFVIGDDVGDGTTLVANVDLVRSVDFQNGPDSIWLWDGSEVRDALGYGVFDGSLVFAGVGNPAPDPPAGRSLARRQPWLDTNDNFTDFEVLSIPTPGTVPVITTNVPNASLLFGSGLLLMGMVLRRGKQHSFEPAST